MDTDNTHHVNEHQGVHPHQSHAVNNKIVYALMAMVILLLVLSLVQAYQVRSIEAIIAGIKAAPLAQVASAAPSMVGGC